MDPINDNSKRRDSIMASRHTKLYLLAAAETAGLQSP